MQLVDPQLGSVATLIGFLGYGPQFMAIVDEDVWHRIIDQGDIHIHLMKDLQSRGLICTVSSPYVFDLDSLNYDGFFTGDATEISEHFPGFAFCGVPQQTSDGVGYEFRAKTYLYCGAGEIALPFQAVKYFTEYLCEDFIPTYIEVIKDITGVDLVWGPPDTSEMKLSVEDMESAWPKLCFGAPTDPAPFRMSSFESLRAELGQRLEVWECQNENHAKFAIDGKMFEVRKVASPRQGYPILEARGRVPLDLKVHPSLPFDEDTKERLTQTQILANGSHTSENTSNMSIVQDPDTGECEMVISTKFPVCDSFPEELHPQLVRDIALNLVSWHEHTTQELAASKEPVEESAAPTKPSFLRRMLGLS